MFLVLLVTISVIGTIYETTSTDLDTTTKMNVQNILAQMHPTQSTVMDGMTDEERFACVISRHCQTMSERQAVLQQLVSEKSELTKYAESMLAEQSSAPDSSSATDASVQ